MNKYILISVADREILTELFESHEEAYNQMIVEMNEASGFSMMEDERIVPCDINEEYDGGTFGYHRYGGYLNDGNNHTDYDWSIVCISE